MKTKEAPELDLSPEDLEWIEAAVAAQDERQAKRRAILSAGREPTLTTRDKILALMAWAEAQKWRNATDYYAYRAFLDAAYRANKLVVGMSQYQLGDAIGVWNQAAWEIIRRLERRGLIEREAPPDEGERDWSLAYRYALALPDEVLQSHVSLDTSFPLESHDSRDNATLVPDLFKGGQGLSKAALRYFEALDPERPQSAAELGRKLKRNRSSVGRGLKQLAAFGLAIESEEGWLKGDADLEKLAEEHGQAEAAERKRAYTERRREGFRAYLKHKAEGGNGEGTHSQDVRPTKGTLVSEAREASPADGRAELPRRSAESLSSDHGPGIPAERMETMGHDLSSVRSHAWARQSLGGMELGQYATEREAACLGCGQVQTFSAPDLKPYSCAYCKGAFVYVDELAMAVA